MGDRKWIIFLIVMLLAAPVSADMYKYIDKNGNTVFTDDYSKVPKEQRKEIEGIPTYETKPSASDQTQSDNNKDEKNGDVQSSDDKQLQKTKDQSDEQTSLFEMRKALQEELKALQKEKETLDKKKGDATKEEIKNFNEKVNSYQEKRKAYDVKVEAHNKKVAKELKEREKRKAD